MNTPIYLFIFFLTGTISLSGQVPDSLKFRSVKPHEFYKEYLSEKNSLIIDVREYFEYRTGRLKGAINIPVSGDIGSASDTIDKEKALFLYCYSGGRSKKAARLLYDKGFRKLYSLDGGIVLWKKERMPVDRKRLRAKG